MSNQKKGKGLFVKIVAGIAAIGIILLALTPLLAILGNK